MLHTIFLYSGSSSVGWIGKYGGSATSTDVIFNAVAVDSDGNALTTGYYSSTSGDWDIPILKIAPSGSIVWGKRYNPNSNQDTAVDIKLDSSGNSYIAGNFYINNSDALLLKYNSTGTLQFQKGYSGTTNYPASYDSFTACAVDSSANIYAVGNYQYNNDPTYTYYVILNKYNSSGSLLWKNLISYPSFPTARGVGVDSSGNVYCSATKGLTSSVIKLNTSGTLQWKTETTSLQIHDTRVDSAGNIYIVGTPSPTTSLIFVKMSNSGSVIWQKTLSAGASNNFYDPKINIDASGNVYCASRIASPEKGFFVKLDSSGSLIWQRTIATSHASGLNLRHIAPDNMGNVYVCGFVYDGTYRGGFLMKVPDDGTGTGTYSPYTYASTAFSLSTASLSFSTSPATVSTPSYTDLTPSNTDTSYSPSVSLVNI